MQRFRLSFNLCLARSFFFNTTKDDAVSNAFANQLAFIPYMVMVYYVWDKTEKRKEKKKWDELSSLLGLGRSVTAGLLISNYTHCFADA